MDETKQLSTWDIPIGGILRIYDRDFKYIKVKNERRPRIGVVGIQHFESQDEEKKQMCFIYGITVIEKDGIYYKKP